MRYNYKDAYYSPQHRGFDSRGRGACRMADQQEKKIAAPAVPEEGNLSSAQGQAR